LGPECPYANADSFKHDYSLGNGNPDRDPYSSYRNQNTNGYLNSANDYRYPGSLYHTDCNGNTAVAFKYTNPDGHRSCPECYANPDADANPNTNTDPDAHVDAHAIPNPFRDTHPINLSGS
jgi:hypothetical protein